MLPPEFTEFLAPIKIDSPLMVSSESESSWVRTPDMWLLPGEIETHPSDSVWTKRVSWSGVRGTPRLWGSGIQYAYSAVSWASIFSRPLRVTSLIPETLQTSLCVLGEELSCEAL